MSLACAHDDDELCAATPYVALVRERITRVTKAGLQQRIIFVVDYSVDNFLD